MKRGSGSSNRLTSLLEDHRFKEGNVSSGRGKISAIHTHLRPMRDKVLTARSVLFLCLRAPAFKHFFSVEFF